MNESHCYQMRYTLKLPRNSAAIPFLDICLVHHLVVYISNFRHCGFFQAISGSLIVNDPVNTCVVFSQSRHFKTVALKCLCLMSWWHDTAGKVNHKPTLFLFALFLEEPHSSVAISRSSNIPVKMTLKDKCAHPSTAWRSCLSIESEINKTETLSVDAGLPESVQREECLCEESAYF